MQSPQPASDAGYTALSDRGRFSGTNIGWLAICFYWVSFALPAWVEGSNRGDALFGVLAFWFGLQSPMLFPTWLANPLGWVATVLFWKKKFKPACIMATVAGVASTFIWFTVHSAWQSLSLGYYVWSLSLFMLAIGSGISWRRRRLEVLRSMQRGFEVLPASPRVK